MLGGDCALFGRLRQAYGERSTGLGREPEKGWRKQVRRAISKGRTEWYVSRKITMQTTRNDHAYAGSMTDYVIQMALAFLCYFLQYHQLRHRVAHATCLINAKFLCLVSMVFAHWKMPHAVGSAVCGALLPTIGTQRFYFAWVPAAARSSSSSARPNTD